MAVQESIPKKTGQAGISQTGIDPAKMDRYSRYLLASEDGKRVSKALYWTEYYEHPNFTYEWNNGILEVKPMTIIMQSDIYQWFVMLLQMYLRIHPIARLTTLGIGFELPLDDGDRVRIPDIGVIRHDNPAPVNPEDHIFAGIFDICIESLPNSHSQHIDRYVKTKQYEYAKAGVKEWFILDTQRNRHMGFYYLTSAGIYQRIPPTADKVIRSSVLPDFQFRLDDLYKEPGLGELADDPVYAEFIWPEYLAMKARRIEAEKERAYHAERLARAKTERVEAEKRRAKAEKELADHLIQQLKELTAKQEKLGIDPDSL